MEHTVFTAQSMHAQRLSRLPHSDHWDLSRPLSQRWLPEHIGQFPLQVPIHTPEWRGAMPAKYLAQENYLTAQVAEPVIEHMAFI